MKRYSLEYEIYRLTRKALIAKRVWLWKPLTLTCEHR